MDHTTVVRDKLTERYLLNELASQVRDEFEEHYFDCPECALDVSAGAQFVEHSKVVLADAPGPVPVHVVSGPAPEHGGWFAWLRFAWLRPAFAAPALALLLAVVGYQNLVTYPRLQSELRQPQVVPAVLVNTGTYGAGGTPTTVSQGQGLLLLVRIPPDASYVYVRYTGELYNPGGKLTASFTITAEDGQDQSPVMFPKIDREAGTYTIALHGISAHGGTKDLGTTSFQLQIQK
jgi:hypothetical protein